MTRGHSLLHVLRKLMLLLALAGATACGQTGALQLPENATPVSRDTAQDDEDESRNER